MITTPTTDERKWLAWLIIIVLIVISTITGVNFPIPAPPDFVAAGTTNLDNLTLDTGLTITSGGATITAGGITVSDGDAAIADDLIATQQTTITLTMAGTLIPTGTYQPVSAAGNIGLSSITAASAGTILLIVNDANVTITFTDTGTLKLSGNAALAQYDTLLLISDGTNWVEVAQADN